LILVNDVGCRDFPRLDANQGATPRLVREGRWNQPAQDAMTSTSALSRTPYDLIGGGVPIRAIVDRFYDLMEMDAAYAELRALHAPDLTPMRESLSSFLAAWTGGPRDWFEDRPGKCMMSVHRGIPITPETGRQWAEAMRRAIEGSILDPALGEKLAGALSDLARRMAGLPAD
jgi:hemoglobin